MKNVLAILSMPDSHLGHSRTAKTAYPGAFLFAFFINELDPNRNRVTLDAKTSLTEHMQAASDLFSASWTQTNVSH